MEIEILATESLGARSLCCLVTAQGQKVLIDPGIALGYTRYGLLPHPLQVAVDERIRHKIVEAWSEATDIVISHFHGDHTPLVHANPYQLSIAEVAGLNPRAKIWAKLSPLSPTETKRVEDLSPFLHGCLLGAAEKGLGILQFSKPVPHGTGDRVDTVVMTRIEDEYVFVHASDIQLLNEQAVSQIVSWQPDIVLVSGPPLYLFKLSKDHIREAWRNAVKLSQEVDTLIIDHHLLRSHAGVAWLEKLSSHTGRNIVCGADFVGRPRMLLEARRRELYEKMPVPKGWHEAYASGAVDTEHYWNLAKERYAHMGLSAS